MHEHVETHAVQCLAHDVSRVFMCCRLLSRAIRQSSGVRIQPVGGQYVYQTVTTRCHRWFAQALAFAAQLIRHMLSTVEMVTYSVGQ